MKKEPKHTMTDLYQMQALPLESKIQMTKYRIAEWVKAYGSDGVYVSFSGGKDSTVLLDLVRQDYPDIEAMFVDVPTQFPELREFAMTFPNVTIIKPKMTFMEVVEKYGFPLISKEVSESVYGAKKYLTSIMNDIENPHDTTRHDTTRHDIPYHYFYEKLRGIGKYAPKSKGESARWSESEVGNNVGNASKESDDKGEYP